MPWKLAALAVATGLVIFLLVAPVFTLRVTVDMPPGAPAPPAQQVQAMGSAVIITLDAIVVALVLAGAGWIAFRIVRGAGNPGTLYTTHRRPEL
jgi:hypothetical protein